LNQTSIDRLKKARTDLSKALGGDPEESEEKIELEKESGGESKVEAEAEAEDAGANSELPFTPDDVFGKYLNILNDTVVADMSQKFNEVKKVKREVEVEDTKIGEDPTDESKMEMKMKLASEVENNTLANSDIESARILFVDTLDAREAIVNGTRDVLIEKYEESPKTEFVVKGGEEVELKMEHKGMLIGSKDEVQNEFQSLVKTHFTDSLIDDLKTSLFENNSAVEAVTEVKVDADGDDDDGDNDDDDDNLPDSGNSTTSTARMSTELSSYSLASVLIGVAVFVAIV